MHDPSNISAGESSSQQPAAHTSSSTPKRSPNRATFAWAISLLIVLGLVMVHNWPAQQEQPHQLVAPIPADQAQSGIMRYSTRFGIAMGELGKLAGGAVGSEAERKEQMQSTGLPTSGPLSEVRLAIAMAEAVSIDAALEQLDIAEEAITQADVDLLERAKLVNKQLQEAQEALGQAQLDHIRLGQPLQTTDATSADTTGQAQLQDGAQADLVASPEVTSPEIQAATQHLERIKQQSSRFVDALDATRAEHVALRSDIEALRQVYTDGSASLTGDQEQRLRDRQRWFADVALSHDAPASDPVRAQLVRESMTLLVGLGVLTITILMAIITSVVLGIIALVRIIGGKTRSRYAAWRMRETRERGPLPTHISMQGFALFLVLFALVMAGTQLAGSAVAAMPAGDNKHNAEIALTVGTPIVLWMTLLAVIWPWLRGQKWADVRQAAGWHTGTGLFREIGAGVVGYIALMPVMLLGIGCTLLLALLSTAISVAAGGSPQSAPSPVEQFDQVGLAGILMFAMLATTWAPVVEETVFRGLFWHHLRTRMHPLTAGLINGFLFAIIHPVGWIAAPALTAIGFNMCMLREWRGSLIPCVTAHALHNGFIMCLLILMLG